MTNKIILIGNMCNDIDVKYTTGETPIMVGRFSLAVARQKKGETDFIPCVVFGKACETLGQYTGKGSKICVQGRLQIDKYTDKEGNSKTSTNVVVSDFEFLSMKENKTTTETQEWDVENYTDCPF